MNNSQFSELIKLECKKKGYKIGTFLEECGLNKGFISDLSRKNKTPSAETILKIADYLEVSVDYLLGREEKIKNIKSIHVGGSVGNNSINNNYSELDKHDRELLEEYNKLSFKNKAKVINLMAELEEETKNKTE